MRPNSSKVDEFISSWIAFGCRAMMVLVVGFFSVLNPKLIVSLTRTRPSQIWKAGFGSLGMGLQLALAEKLVPSALL